MNQGLRFPALRLYLVMDYGCDVPNPSNPNDMRCHAHYLLIHRNRSAVAALELIVETVSSDLATAHLINGQAKCQMILWLHSDVPIQLSLLGWHVLSL